MTFEQYWITQVEPNWDKAFFAALDRLVEAYQSGHFDAKEKARKGWEEHGGKIRDWGWLECGEAAYEECQDLLVYEATGLHNWNNPERRNP